MSEKTDLIDGGREILDLSLTERLGSIGADIGKDYEVRAPTKEEEV